MAYKQFQLDPETEVTVYKRRTSRHLRLTVGANGEIKVSIPTWAAYGVGVQFARSRLNWIKQQQKPRTLLSEGLAIGKAHHLHFVPSQSASRPASRLLGSNILVTYPFELDITDAAVQKAAERGCLRALKEQAEALLPQRLQNLAQNHGFSYRSVGVKQLKSRWGSCDHQQNINLNIFLMQLPWELIDYVLIHELVHTRVLKHGPDFWSEFEAVWPNAKRLRRRLREHQPVLQSISAV
ncbi:MAG TPA: SprT family zinc-dependent metalloprotease [Candidatus Saccharimonadales bacterium]|nr:SprT family zinc-dependent metalloprotease [Candidatus Saccharimonadales bacterium]